MIDGNKKAKIYGIIAVIFFIYCFMFIISGFLFEGAVISGAFVIIVDILAIIFLIGIILTIVFGILAIYTHLKYRTKVAPIDDNITIMQNSTLFGGIVSIIGFVLLVYAGMSYNGLQERYGELFDMVQSSTRISQEIFTYQIIGLIGFILIISGILIAVIYKNKKVQQVSNQTINTNSVTSNFCSGCGAKLPLDSKFCKECGKKV